MITYRTRSLAAMINDLVIGLCIYSDVAFIVILAYALPTDKKSLPRDSVLCRQQPHASCVHRVFSVASVARQRPFACARFNLAFRSRMLRWLAAREPVLRRAARACSGLGHLVLCGCTLPCPHEDGVA